MDDWMVRAIRAIATMPNTTVARVLMPTTRVRTATLMFKTVGLLECRGLSAKFWAMDEVSVERANVNPPAINAPVKQRKGVGRACSTSGDLFSVGVGLFMVYFAGNLISGAR